MKLFNKPSWLKPEINDPIYLIHLIILTGIQIFIAGYFIELDFTLWNFIFVMLINLGADVIAHTLLRLD